MRCNSRSLELLFVDCPEIFIPSMIGLIKVIEVQIAAIPIAPAPMETNFRFPDAHCELRSSATIRSKHVGSEVRWKPAYAMSTPTRDSDTEAIPIR